MAKKTNARLGVLIYVVVAGGAVALTTAFGWCGSEQYTKRDLLLGVERVHPTPCGVVRFVTLGLLDWVPCQVWNLIPLTLIAVFALVWLARDFYRSRG